MPRYEFVEGTSSKFWEIALEEGTKLRTRWGRIGTAGQEKEEEFDNLGEARTAYEKAIQEKVKKGYQLVPEGPDAAASAASPPLGDLAEYAGYLQLTWHLGSIQSVRVALDYDAYEGGLRVEEHVLPALFRNPLARSLRELTIGCACFDGENEYGDVIKVIAKSAPATLRSLFLGDFTLDESELSWSHLGNAEPLWKALPGLQQVKLRAGSMTLGAIELPECQEFTVMTGGLSRASMKSIAQARWPKLERLEIWFGDENYGAECTVKDVQPVLDAKGLPHLRRLGLRNAEFTDALADVLPGSKVLSQLEELDLSLGILTDAGADKLVAAKSAYLHLKKLDLSENLLGAEAVKRVRSLGAFVVAKDQRDNDDPEYRYVAVGE